MAMDHTSDPDGAYEIVTRDSVPAPSPRPNANLEERVAELRLWLQPTDYLSPGNEFMKHLASYAPGTGTWIQTSPVFRAWAEPKAAAGHGHVSCLHARGVAGSGKSVFAANTIRKLQDAGFVVLFFFFRQIVDKNHSAKYLVRDFAAQLLPRYPALVAPLAAFSRDHPIDGSESTAVWPAVVKALGELGEAGEKVCCVVDALDEMDNDDFDSMVERLLALGTINPDKIRVLMTSRPLTKIEQSLRNPIVAQLKLDPALMYADVARCVDARMASLEPPLSSDRSELVKHAICERAGGLFLHARLVTDNLAEGLLDGRITEATLPDSLDRLPRSLRHVYEDMLKDHARRSGVSADQQSKILMCVTHASRPLRLIELASLLSRMLGLDLGRGKDLVRAGCGRLLEILEDETVSVIHHSFTEFLNDVSRTTDKDAFPVLDAPSSHAMLAMLSLEYLDNCTSPGLAPDGPETAHLRYGTDYDRQKAGQLRMRLAHPLAGYACENLDYHLEKAAAQSGPPHQLLAALDDHFAPGKLALENWWLLMVPGIRTVGSQNIFHMAAQFRYSRGLSLFVLEHFAKNIPGLLDAHDDAGRSPLSYAAEMGNAQLASLLLSQGAIPTTADRDGETPLHWAAARGGPEVVRLLLDAGVDPLIRRGRMLTEQELTEKQMSLSQGKASAWRNTAMHSAFKAANPEVVKAFLPFVTRETVSLCFHQVEDVENMEAIMVMGKPDINSFWRGTTKLCRVAGARNLKVMKLLLSHGADPNRRSCRDKFDYDTIHTGFDEILAEIDVEDFERGPTPLHALAGYLDECEVVLEEEKEATMECVRALVEAGADVNATMDEKRRRGSAGLTPLHIAVKERFSEFFWGSDDKSEEIVMEALISAGADPNAKTKAGDAPIHGIDPGKMHVLLKLVEFGADVNSRNSFGRTPMIEVIRRISNGTILTGSSKEANLKNLMEFLELGPDMSIADNEGNTVMHYVMQGTRHLTDQEHIAFVKRLIDTGADLNRPNIEGQPPIHRYKRCDYKGSVRKDEDLLRFLFDAGMDLNARDKQGKSVLFAIAENHDADIAALENLVRLGADPTAVDNSGDTLLHAAIKHHKPAKWIHFLISAGARPEALGSGGDNLLHILLRQPNLVYSREMIPVLLNLGVPPLAKNAKGQSALHVAGELSGLKDIFAQPSFMEHLITHPSFQGLDLNEPDLDGFTPLHTALQTAREQGDELIGIQLRAGANPATLAYNGLSPLHLAARAGNANAVGLLLAQYQTRGVLGEYANLLGDGRTPLHYACWLASTECVRELLRSGANPTVRDVKGLTPLHALAEEDVTELRFDTLIPRRTTDIVKMLQMAGADLSAEAVIDETEDGIRGTTSVTALDLAVKLKRWELARALLSRGVEPRDSHKHSEDFVISTDKERASAEARAADARISQSQNRSGIRTQVEGYDWRGRWASNTAATFRWDTHFISDGQALLDTSTEVDDDAMDRLDALERSLCGGDYDSIDEYVRLGGTLYVPHPRHGRTFLHRLLEWGYADLLERYGDQVVAMEAQLEVQGVYDKYGSLLAMACDREAPSLYIIKLLVDKLGLGVDTLYCFPAVFGQLRGATALHCLASGSRFWQIEALEYMLSKGADVDARSGRGLTPLHVAVSPRSHSGFWNIETARVLLRHGADPNAVVLVKNDDGSTTHGASAIEMWGEPNVTKLLMENGARIESLEALVAQAVYHTMRPATVELLLEAKLDPNELPPVVKKDEDASTEDLVPPVDPSRYALHEAALPSKFGSAGADFPVRQKAIIDMLLMNGADPWASYPDGSSVLQLIVEGRGLTEQVMSHVKQGEVERKSRHGRTLLLSACVPAGPPRTEFVQGSKPPVVLVDVMHSLLDRGANVLVTDDEEGRTPLHWFCTFTGDFDEPHRKALVALAERSAEGLGRADRLGRKPMHLALAAYTDGSQASAFAVRHLMALGADMGERDPVSSDSVLHMIARRMVGEKAAAAEAAAMFREAAAGQDVNDRNASGETPVLSFAAAGWRPTSDPEGRVPHPRYALENDVMHAAALDVFVELGADLAAVDARGRTLLHVTAGRVVPPDGHWASWERWDQHEDIEGMFKKLMDLGVDPRREDGELRTAIDVAVARGLKGVLGLFTEERREVSDDDDGDEPGWFED